MERLIAVCVEQQLRRPVLARLLDLEESRPAFRDEMGGLSAYEAILREIVRRPEMPKVARPDVAAGDLAALVRGIVDAAGERGETDPEDLERRVRAAVFGYLAGMADGG